MPGVEQIFNAVWVGKQQRPTRHQLGQFCCVLFYTEGLNQAVQHHLKKKKVECREV